MPAVFLYTCLMILPSILGLMISFFQIHGLNFSTMKFVGFDNFVTIFQDPYTTTGLKNTLIFAVVTTIGKVGLGLLFALLVNKKCRETNYIRTIMFLPAVLNNIAVGLVFRAIMYPTGILNTALTTIGLGFLTQNWLTDPDVAIYSCCLVEIWKWSGYTMVILLAGLQSIDTTYYEAAEIDGASKWQQLKSITIPLIMPAFKNSIILSLVGGLKVFDIVQSLTKGGPGRASAVFNTIIYGAFGSGSYGRGCAATVILTLIVLLFSLPTNQFLSKKEVEA